MDFKDIIKNHLDKMAEQDFCFAEKYKNEKKTLDGCCKYIYEQAKKKKSGNCAAVQDDVVYGWAVHYYMEDNIKPEPIKERVEVKIPDIKPVKAVKAEKKSNCIELDLFGGF